MEGNIFVPTLFRQKGKAVDIDWRSVRKEFNDNIAAFGLDGSLVFLIRIDNLLRRIVPTGAKFRQLGEHFQVLISKAQGLHRVIDITYLQ